MIKTTPVETRKPRQRHTLRHVLAPFLLALSFLVSVSQARAENDLILLTAFAPFGGALENASRTFAEAVARSPAWTNVEGTPVEVKICVLPVLFDQAADAAKKCFETLPTRPRLVVSLGEEQCALRLETAAHHWSSRWGDVSRRSIGMTLPIEDLYCRSGLTPQEQRELIISASPGRFVCNHTAYQLAEYFQTYRIPYSFVHVPSHSCDGFKSGERERLADSLTKLLVRAVSLSRDPSAEFGRAQMPTNLRQIEDALKSLGASPDRKCETAVLRTLRKAQLSFLEEEKPRF